MKGSGAKKKSQLEDLMHKAIEAGDLKKAMHHKIIANIAIDEMVSVSKFVQND